MIKSIFWYLNFVISLILQTGNLKKSKRILKEQGEKAFEDFVFEKTTSWAKQQVDNSGAKITVHNVERIPQDRNVLFVSNHQSDFDIAVFMALIPKRTGFVAKSEMEKVPFLSDWMRNINCVFMDRTDMKKSLETILAGIKLLKEGKSLVVFPEGTRSRCDEVGEFKQGSFKLATKSNVPIVPVTIDGTYKIMEGNNYIIKPAEVNVYIHEPIFMESLDKEGKAMLPQTVKDIIVNGKA